MFSLNLVHFLFLKEGLRKEGKEKKEGKMKERRKDRWEKGRKGKNLLMFITPFFIIARNWKSLKYPPITNKLHILW